MTHGHVTEFHHEQSIKIQRNFQTALSEAKPVICGKARRVSNISALSISAKHSEGCQVGCGAEGPVMSMAVCIDNVPTAVLQLPSPESAEAIKAQAGERCRIIAVCQLHEPTHLLCTFLIQDPSLMPVSHVNQNASKLDPGAQDEVAAVADIEKSWWQNHGSAVGLKAERAKVQAEWRARQKAFDHPRVQRNRTSHGPCASARWQLASDTLVRGRHLVELEAR